MPRLSPRQDRDHLSAREQAEIADDHDNPVDGLLYAGRDPLADHRARVRAANEKRQRSEAAGESGALARSLAAEMAWAKKHAEGQAGSAVRQPSPWRTSRRRKGTA